MDSNRVISETATFEYINPRWVTESPALYKDRIEHHRGIALRRLLKAADRLMLRSAPKRHRPLFQEGQLVSLIQPMEFVKGPRAFFCPIKGKYRVKKVMGSTNLIVEKLDPKPGEKVIFNERIDRIVKYDPSEEGRMVEYNLENVRKYPFFDPKEPLVWEGLETTDSAVGTSDLEAFIQRSLTNNTAEPSATTSSQPQLTSTVEQVLEIENEPYTNDNPELAVVENSENTQILPPPPTEFYWTYEQVASAELEKQPPPSQDVIDVIWSENQEPVSRNERPSRLRSVPRVNYRDKRTYVPRQAKINGRVVSFDQLRFCAFKCKPVVNLKACILASKRHRRTKPKKTTTCTLASLRVEAMVPDMVEVNRSLALRADKIRVSAMA